MIIQFPDSTRFAGEFYQVKTLLGAGDSNAKLAKSDASGQPFMTVGLSLAPSDMAGIGNLCPLASEGCRAACLMTAGNGAYPSVAKGRTAKAIAFQTHRAEFLARLMDEIGKAERKATKQGKRLAVRLNVLSDIQWERIAPDIFTSFPDVQFYDYTKIWARFDRVRPANYHLTFSRSESNGDHAQRLAARGVNVAVVFSGGLPTEFYGRPVVDGDQTDLRFLEPEGVIIGLKAKGKARGESTGFVVDARVLAIV